MAGSRNRPSPDSVPDLDHSVRAALAGAGLQPGARLCLGLSGGVDSVALLHLLHRLGPALGFHLAAVHVHHGLSPHADHWVTVCAAHCAHLGVPFAAERVRVARNHPQGLEAAARLARYAVLEAQPADWLVLGHHQDDQAETLIFRLLRGTGLRGAGAVRAVERPPRGLPRLRPLLASRRRDIEAWARAQGLAWVEDESNADPRHPRNRLRRVLLPAWEAAFPAMVPALARAVGHFQEASDLLDELAAQDDAACRQGEGWCLAAFAALSAPRRRNLVRWRVRQAGAAAPEAARLTESLRQIETAGPGAGLRLPLGELALGVFRGRVWLEPAVLAPPQPVGLRLADLAAVEQAGSAAACLVWPWGPGRVVIAPAVGQGLAVDRLAGAACELTRPWPGLRLRLGARRPSRSFKNLCQEAGLPPWWRASLPVLRVDGQAAWIGSVGPAAEFACPPGGPGIVLSWEAGGPGVAA
jgi:tRNA(Ile)-lysidine synthase